MDLPAPSFQPVRYGLFTPSRIFLMAAISWLLGMAWPVVNPSPWTTLIAVSLAGIAVAIKKNKSVSTTLILVGVFMGASIYHSWYLNHIIPDVVYDREQIMTATVLAAPTKYDTYLRYTVTMEGGWQSYLLLPRLKAEIRPPVRLTLKGRLERIGEDDAIYRLGRAKNHIFATIPFPNIVATQSPQLNWFESLTIVTREQFDRATHILLLDPQAGLLAGIIAGNKSDLPASLLENFKTSGLTHIIAVSGYNVSILISLIMSATRRLGRHINLALAVVFISFFVIVTGASASVVRAGILALLLFIARYIGRRAAVFRLLVTTGAIMTFENPLIVRYDIGFQLSFGAVLGLMSFAEPFEAWLVRHNIPSILGSNLAATTAATLMTWPIIAHYFGTISMYTLPANLVVGPIIPFVTLFGLTAVTISTVLPFFSSWFGPPLDLALRLIINVATVAGNLPYASLSIKAIPAWLWLLYYGFLILVIPRTKSAEIR